MRLRIASNFGRGSGNPLLFEPRLNELFGIRIHRDGQAERFEPANAFEQVWQVRDGFVTQRTHDCARSVAEPGGQQDAQLQALAVRQMYADIARAVGTAAHSFRELSPCLFERMENMLARAERILAEIRAGTV
jgi:hypothetical protein